MKGWMSVCAGTVTALCLAFPLAGQDLDIERLDLPLNVAQEVVRFFGDPATSVIEGTTDVAAGEFVAGPLAVLEGTLSVFGTVEGDVMVINGDVELGPQGRIEGDLTVIGGAFDGPVGQISGELTVYRERYEFERRARRIGADEDDDYYYESRGRRSRSRLSTRSEVNYNRVEGLPIMFGPVIQVGRENESRLDLLAIYRTESGFDVDTDDLGYFLRAEQSFGRRNRITFAATAHSMVEPIDRWRLDDFEASLGTLLIHEDYRDYYERVGFGLAARGRVPEAGLFMEVQYLDEEHGFERARDPWSVREVDTGWRPQPLVAEGDLRSLRGEITIDHRNDRDDPSDGWYFSAKGTLGLDGDLEVPAYLRALPGPAQPGTAARSVSADFKSGLFDLRKYTRLGPNADLGLRAMWAGSLTDEALPSQFQHALGGVGSLPGYPLLSGDCGARDRLGSVQTTDAGRVRAFPSYGCDRMALFQAQYRGTFSIDLGGGDDEWDNDWDDEFDDEWDWSSAMDFNPSWTVFFDAGKGWSNNPLGENLGYDTDTLMDVGVGFYVGGVGLYWAWPLTGDSRKGNFFVRLEHRF